MAKYDPVSGEEDEYGICASCMEAFEYQDLNDDLCAYCILDNESRGNFDKGETYGYVRGKM